MESKVQSNKGIRKLIVALSIIIPLAVAALFGIKIENPMFSFLPHVYATINGITAVLLLAALIAVKRKQYALHENLIKSSMGLSVLFLLLYVLYHITSQTTFFGDLDHSGKVDSNESMLISDFALITYYVILISHIFLSIAVVPLVLFTYLHAWEGNYEKHRKLTRFAWPIWFYVAVSGVVVYWMISPYY